MALSAAALLDDEDDYLHGYEAKEQMIKMTSTACFTNNYF